MIVMIVVAWHSVSRPIRSLFARRKLGELFLERLQQHAKLIQDDYRR